MIQQSSLTVSAVFQGGFIPDIVLYLSYWYPSRQLPLRLAFFWVAADFSKSPSTPVKSS